MSRQRGAAALAIAAAALAVLAAFVPGIAAACGACDEDKVAATYDHAVVTQARAGGQVMVFCAVSGRFDSARLKAAAGRVRGIRPDSVRVSAEPAALSFAVDPQQRSVPSAVAAAQRALAGGARLSVVRVVMPPARVPA